MADEDDLYDAPQLAASSAASPAPKFSVGEEMKTDLKVDPANAPKKGGRPRKNIVGQKKPAPSEPLPDGGPEHSHEKEPMSANPDSPRFDPLPVDVKSADPVKAREFLYDDSDLLIMFGMGLFVGLVAYRYGAKAYDFMFPAPIIAHAAKAVPK